MVVISNNDAGESCAARLRECAEVMHLHNVDVSIENISGSLGELSLSLSYSGKREYIECDALVIAKSEEVNIPVNGIPQSAFGKMDSEQLSGKSVVILHCGRASESALANALRAARHAHVYFIASEVDSAGAQEKLYDDCARAGVIFFKTDVSLVQLADGRARVFDRVLGAHVILQCDILIIDDKPHAITLPKDFILPSENEKRAWLAEARLPDRSGVFWLGDSDPQTGTCAGNLLISLVERLTDCPHAYKVDEDACRLCLTCMRVCPLGVPRFGENGKSHIDERTCCGCGVCAGECPAGAIARDER